jgi:hypothetical protein
MYEARMAKGDRAVLKRHLRRILEAHARHPAYQKVGGVPVIHLFGMLSTGFSAEDYAAAARELREEGDRIGQSFVCALLGDSSQDPRYFYGAADGSGAASGLYEWINLGAFADPVDGRGLRRSAAPETWEAESREKAFAAAKGRADRIVLGSVYPGFDDSRLGKGNWDQGPIRLLDDQGGRVFERTAEYAVAQGFPWTIVQTWNDFNEGSQVEPSVERPERIFQTLTLAARLKKGALDAKTADPARAVELLESFGPANLARLGAGWDDRRREAVRRLKEMIPGVRDAIRRAAGDAAS